MKTLLVVLMFSTTGCSTMMAMREMDTIQKEGAVNTVAGIKPEAHSLRQADHLFQSLLHHAFNANL